MILFCKKRPVASQEEEPSVKKRGEFAADREAGTFEKALRSIEIKSVASGCGTGIWAN